MRALVLLLAACAGSGDGHTGATGVADDGDPCTVGPNPSLTIGEGLEGYETVDEGGSMSLIHGPQGGYHIEIGLELRDLEVDGLVAGTLEGEVGGEVLATSAPFLDFRCASGEGLQSSGTLLVYASTPEALDGATTTITATVTGTDGTVVEASTSFVIVDAP